jgi:hypothetical protein
VIGRAYLLAGERVTVVCRWAGTGGPRNVLLERADGSRFVRPFRGLRRAEPDPAQVVARLDAARQRLTAAAPVEPSPQLTIDDALRGAA